MIEQVTIALHTPFQVPHATHVPERRRYHRHATSTRKNGSPGVRI